MEDFKVPDFDSLPKVEGMPQGCAWGIFDKEGGKDVFGTLNLLTPSVVKAALTEAEEGVSISLNWPITAIKTRLLGRKLLDRKVLNLEDNPHVPFTAFDDEIEFNTQCSSQWDSLCHLGHQPTKFFYNGVKLTIDMLAQPSGAKDSDPCLPTLDHWHKRGGIVGRGVLLDYKSYADTNGISYSPFSGHSITVQDLEAVAKVQKTTFKQGDILIVRSGYTEAMGILNQEQQDAALASGGGGACGVEGTVSTAKWFWNHHFAAVAGDTIAFEAISPAKIMEDGKNALVLHQYFLSLFGMPIGELWDLKALSEACAKRKKWTFLLTSVPLNYPNAIGSPPNALAIF